jgi:hypothetical protein
MHGLMCAGCFIAFFDCLKALNANSTSGRHIPLQINHMSDIISYNDFSTVTSELMIFLLCKLQKFNIPKRTTYGMDTSIQVETNEVIIMIAFGMEVTVYSRYIPGICHGKNLEYVRVRHILLVVA